MAVAKFQVRAYTSPSMSDSSTELDLKFLPDWLKEGPSTNRYADFAGEPERTIVSRLEAAGGVALISAKR